MKIVQAFSILNTNSIPQFHGEKINIKYLNLYYSFLYSYVTLKKHYGAVTMYSDKKTYLNFIKYIPYDHVVFFENKYLEYKELWSIYKIEALKQVKEPFIFVDPDVYIYDYVFDKFISSDNDILVQAITEKDKNYLNFFNLNKPFFETNNIPLPFDNLCWDGVFGVKNIDIFKKYVKIFDVFLNGYLNNKFICDDNSNISFTEFCEVIPILSTTLKHNLSLETIYSQNEYDLYELLKFNNKYKFCHLVGETKYRNNVIDLIKKEIYENYNEYYKYITIFEKEKNIC
jgi:hypothetical protein